MEICGNTTRSPAITIKEVNFLLSVFYIAQIENFFITKSGIIRYLHHADTGVTILEKNGDFHLTKYQLIFLKSYFELVKDYPILRRRKRICELLNLL